MRLSTVTTPMIRPFAGQPVQPFATPKLCFGMDMALPQSLASQVQDPMMPLTAFEKAVENRLREMATAPKGQRIAELTEVLDLFLYGTSKPLEQAKKKAFILQTLQQEMGPRGQGYMALAQTNFRVGDLLGNSRKIMTAIDTAEKAGVDTIVFPEMALMGYPVEDAIGLYPQLAEENVRMLKEIAARTQKTRAIVGFVEPRGEVNDPTRQGRKFFNSLAILGDGQILGIVRKSLLPNYGEFNENRQFEPSPAAGVQPPETLCSPTWGFDGATSKGNLADMHGITVAPLICEDGWAKQTRLYRRDPISEMALESPQVYVFSEYSPTRAGKERLKHTMWSNIAKVQQRPVITVNAIGGNDDLVFDGTSRMYGPSGQLIARGKAFEEQFMIVNPLKEEGKVYPLPDGLEKTLTEPLSFDPRDPNDVGRTYLAARLALRDYFHKNGFTKAVIGASGGIDSTMALVTAVDALGKENVIAFGMPSEGISSAGSVTDAEKLANNLGIPYIQVPIGGAFGMFKSMLQPVFEQVEKIWGKSVDKPVTLQNIQARIRSLVLWAMTNQFGKVLSICTTNKSEALIGNGTVIGDASGGYALWKDVPKSKIYPMAQWLNEHGPVKNAIPVEIITKEPSAELDELTDRQRYGSSYLFRDEAMERLLAGQSIAQMMQEKFIAEGEENISTEEKRKALQKLFDLFGKNIFKTGVLPLGPVLDWGGLTKGELKLPTTLSQAKWEKLTDAEITKALVVD